ncbi:MAG: hypothetical protein CME32_11780 [Gimesia sp.]|nr:hypothetical protein [Gimesia sp.]
MSDYHIYLDDSGTLKSGTFFDIEIPLNDSFVFNSTTEGWTFFSSRTPTEDELSIRNHHGQTRKQWFRGEISDEKFRANKRCQLDKNHVTEEYASYLKLKPEYDENTLYSEFNLVSSMHYQYPIVTESFKERIEKSGLKGADFLPLTVDSHCREKYPDAPLLFAIQFMGKKCTRQLRIQGAKDECPFCGRQNLFCKECGFSNLQCPDCSNYVATSIDGHKGPNDKRLKFSPVTQRRFQIMEGHKWDGADFIYGGGFSSTYPNIVSKRALDWLLSVHAVHFCARPIQVCIDSMTDQQLEKLEYVQKPVVS